MNKIIAFFAFFRIDCSHGPARRRAARGSASPQAVSYYVATNGDDINGDGSQGNPWATITHALDNVPDGSTILVHAGDI